LCKFLFVTLSNTDLTNLSLVLITYESVEAFVEILPYAQNLFNLANIWVRVMYSKFLDNVEYFTSWLNLNLE
jgi:hypothetical protein